MLRKSSDCGRKTCATTAEGGFTLVEMMIVVTIIATLAAIIMPRVNNHLDESRRVATVSDLRSVSVTWSSYLLMTGNSLGSTGAFLDPNSFQSVSVSDLAALLGTDLPVYDHFGNLLDYRVDRWPDPTFLIVRSPGKGGTFEPGYDLLPNVPNPGPCTGYFTYDIVMVNGIMLARLKQPCWPMD